MCAIIGIYRKKTLKTSNKIVNFILENSKERGRDGYGKIDSLHCTIANFRAEPTNEYVKDKKDYDQQPYTLNHWSIVHNGTIANDEWLRTKQYPSSIDSACIVEQLSISQEKDQYDNFINVIQRLKGSYAILAINHNSEELFIATNYKPIWFIETEDAYYFASSEEYFPSDTYPKQTKPYSIHVVNKEGLTTLVDELRETNNKTLVVCSGGLDSSVVATLLKKEGHDIHLLHFLYGTRSEAKEKQAIQNVSEYLNCGYSFIPMYIYKNEDSGLLNDGIISPGKEGTEFANEWVPARNLVMLSLAIAYAETNKFSYIALGNNLEESGAYPDNEQEFIRQFNKLIPFSVKAGHYLKLLMPIGNLMKKEIVKLGVEINAPLHLTWSCYHDHKLHCGNCGPCYMRKKAFLMNNLTEVIEYEQNNL